jgi:hypothetical protein
MQNVYSYTAVSDDSQTKVGGMKQATPLLTPQFLLEAP